MSELRKLARLHPLQTLLHTVPPPLSFIIMLMVCNTVGTIFFALPGDIGTANYCPILRVFRIGSQVFLSSRVEQILIHVNGFIRYMNRDVHEPFSAARLTMAINDYSMDF